MKKDKKNIKYKPLTEEEFKKFCEVMKNWINAIYSDEKIIKNDKKES
jgi:hypothetical protein